MIFDNLQIFLRSAVWATIGLLLIGCVASAQAVPKEKVQGWVTTGDQKKLLSRVKDIPFDTVKSTGVVIDVDANVRYQEMVGFGAALTDASAWLLHARLNPKQRTALMQELFGKPPGIGISFIRLTIGASDFSRSHYTFDDVGAGQSDLSLAHFSIEPNRTDVIPIVKEALVLNPDLKVMASPWSAPAWMKNSDRLIQGGLKPEAYGAFAEYLHRYVDAYAGEDIPIFAITLQNEPHFEPANYPGMRVAPDMRARFIGGYLGPLFARENPSVRILDWDHNWDQPNSPMAVLGDPEAEQYVSGVAWHCYGGEVNAQSAVHDAYPGKDTYLTECSGGQWLPQWAANLQYFVGDLMIRSTRAWAKGVLLWNLALDENHGPHLGGCEDCRGVVTIDSRTGAVTRNAEYYALAHVSRFVRQGARRIASTREADGIDSVAFRNADDGSLVLVVANPTVDARALSVREAGRSFHVRLDPSSVATFTWKAAAL